jgi:hypothetical protein
VAKNPPADMAERMMIIERGKRALDRAIAMRKDYFEAMVYLSLLYRQQAPLEADPAKQQELVATANKIRDDAVAIVRKKKAEAAAASAKKS